MRRGVVLATGAWLALMVCAMAGCSDDGERSSLASDNGREGVTTLADAGAVPEMARTLYVRHCASCHGIEGHGDGPAAEQLYPKPRAFRDSPLRFTARGGNTVTVVASVAHVIRNGLARSAMPGFAQVLTDEEITLLARYVTSLEADAPVFTPPASARIGRRPPTSQRLIDEGASLYRTMVCVNCHGPSGRGDGPAARGLLDAMGRPIRPGDLASGQYKSGPGAYDLYRTIVQGVPGTPMAGYGPLLIETRKDAPEDDRRVWALVAFIESLAPARRFDIKLAGAEIHTHAVDAAMLLDPSDTRWVPLPMVPVVVRPLWQRTESTTALDVAAVRAGDLAGFHLLWDDPTPDVEQDSGRFPDGVAVMFALGDEVPALPMGVDLPESAGTAPVNIWHWKASRQYDASRGRRGDSDDPRTLSPGNFHHFGLAGEVDRAVHGADPVGAGGVVNEDLRQDEVLYRTAVAVGNTHANPALVDRATLEANAEGFGTLTYQAEAMQDVQSTAVWANGHWFVTLFRPARTGQPLDVALEPGRRLAVALAVWDGSKGDRDGVKLVSGWHWLVVRE